MYSLSKILRTAVIPFRYRLSRAMFSRNCSSACGDGDNKSGDDKEPCDPCPTYSSPCDSNPSIPTMYECRKYGHTLPSNTSCPSFEPLPNIPTGIFRCTTGETLGKCGAAKTSYYKNPEYFSFQHMTYYDMHLILRPCRQPSPTTGRKA